MNTPTLRLKSPADLLALVPCVLGFHPQDSLVLVVVQGPGSSLHARLDLSFDEEEMAVGIAHVVAAVLRNGGRKVALVAYTDDPAVAELAVDRLDERLFECGIDVTAAIRADGTHWFNLFCEDDCCTPEGRPYDLSSHPITAQYVLEGHVTLASREELADTLVGTDTDDIEAVAAAADAAIDRFREVAGPPVEVGVDQSARRHLVAEGHWVRDRVRRYLTDRERLDAEDAGRMAVAMVNIEVRDVAWSEITRDNARTHVELWRDLVRRTPLDLVPAPAALLAFAAWLSGDGALAWCAVDRCRQAEPGYSMAELISSALASAVPPSTWVPVPPEELPLFAG